MTSTALRRFSKLTCFATLFLIFAGSLVTSTGSGLAVPDWPLSYGTLFPPMVGGVFYEHGHRMVASFVGLLTLILAIWIWRKEQRRWVRNLGIIGLGAVIAQGLLGGLTVIYFLPTPVSVAHGVLAQTFFIITIIIAYALSLGRHARDESQEFHNVPLCKMLLTLTILVYLQLMVGAIMRHTGSGLAIPDFPKMGGEWVPSFSSQMLAQINWWRFDLNLDPVTRPQVFVHFLHRVMAGIIFLCAIGVNMVAFKNSQFPKDIKSLVVFFDIMILIQITLGVATVLTQKAAYITSFHVATGAALLGFCVVMVLKSFPLTLLKTKELLLSK